MSDPIYTLFVPFVPIGSDSGGGGGGLTESEVEVVADDRIALQAGVSDGLATLTGSTLTPSQLPETVATDSDITTAVDAEATSRATADTALGVRIDGVESNYIPSTQKGSANGVATLDGNGKLPDSQLPDITPESIGAADVDDIYDGSEIEAEVAALTVDVVTLETSDTTQNGRLDLLESVEPSSDTYGPDAGFPVASDASMVVPDRVARPGDVAVWVYRSGAQPTATGATYTADVRKNGVSVLSSPFDLTAALAADTWVEIVIPAATVALGDALTFHVDSTGATVTPAPVDNEEQGTVYLQAVVS